MTTTTFTDNSKSRFIYNQSGTYNSTWAAAVGVLSDGNAQSNGQLLYSAQYYIYRGMFIFDTSPIPAGDIISAAKLRLYITAVPGSDNFDVNLQHAGAHPADPVVAGDYDKSFYAGAGMSAIGRAAVVAAIGSYLEMPFNSTGLTWITKAGTTRLCVRIATEIAGQQPAADERWQYQGPLQANPPKLVVTYSSPSSSRPNNSKLFGAMI